MTYSGLAGRARKACSTARFGAGDGRAPLLLTQIFFFVALLLGQAVHSAPVRADDLKIQTGPILGAFDAGYFTVTCCTNQPASVRVARVNAAGEQETAVADSAAGQIHRLKVPRTAAAAQGEARAAAPEYVLIAAGDGQGGSAGAALSVKLAAPPPITKGEKFTFVAMGDSRTYPDKWAVVAAAARKSNPRFVLFTGDMVSDGADEASWERDFFGPAKELFAATPFYTVRGNHERRGARFDEIIYSPSPDGRARHWSQRQGDATIIGVDGLEDWSAGGENAKWLEGVLAACDSKFIFLADHYPAWTSSTHGKLDAAGRPMERPTREGQDVILPLLAKYKATAFLAGHDHCYERSEPEGGVTVIITGGAGAPLYPKAADAEKQNPWSRVFASRLNYCLFEISGDVCEMKALSPDGALIDTRTWRAR